jgi:4-aminobutyrate aminotransferase-like enzyme
MVQRHELFHPEFFRQTAVSTRAALSILLPQHEVPVLARTGDEMRLLRDRNGTNLIGVAAQQLGFLPGARVPEAKRLIGRRGDQTSSVFGKGQVANPTGVSVEPAEELASRLRKWVAPSITHMFFSDDGSTAVEVALKLALQYFSNTGRSEKREIVALEHGYHGDTAGAMSVSDDSPFTDPFRSMRYPVHRVHSAYCYRCPVGLRRESCHIECVGKLEELLAERGKKIAAVIAEPLLQHLEKGHRGLVFGVVEFWFRWPRWGTPVSARGGLDHGRTTLTHTDRLLGLSGFLAGPLGSSP